MSKVHTLKTLNPYFTDVWEGRKTAEVRLNDRNFERGDVLELREVEAGKDTSSRPMRTVRRLISCVTPLTVVDEDLRNFVLLSFATEYCLYLTGDAKKDAENDAQFLRDIFADADQQRMNDDLEAHKRGGIA